jgi:hypothetical protein
MIRPMACLLALSTLTAAAAAHPGNHTQMTLIELVRHTAEADHLAFLALNVIVGILAFRAGRRAEAKVMVKRLDQEKRS